MKRHQVFSIPSKTLSRRALLRGAGGIALGLPFLDVMAPRVSLAQASTPKRFVVVFTANGMIKDQWQPGGGETDFTFSPILSPLEAHRNNLLIMRGLNNEASFAALCGTSPVEASSGKHHAHRLNRGGNRHANNALHTVVLHRWRTCDTTKTYVAKRRAEGKSDRAIRRCLKRALARRFHRLLIHDLTSRLT